MMNINIPGTGDITIDNVLLDYNGTIAVDGYLIKGVEEKINQFSSRLAFHVVTADTFGFVKKELENVGCTLSIIPKNDQAKCKLEYLKKLGPQRTLCAGNGANDKLILKEAVLGVAILQEEGLSSETLFVADLVVRSVLDLFKYFEKPNRLIASLRK